MNALFLLFGMMAASPEIGALQDADARVAAIAWRLQTVNVSLCTDIAPLAGLTIQTLGQYQPSVRASIAAQTGLTARPDVQVVVAGAPADRAGLRAGDVIFAIDGVAVPRELPPGASYAATAKAETMIESGLSKPPMVLRVARGRGFRTIRITGVPGCASRVEIVTGENLNAQADGQYVQVSGSLVEFADNDDELATVIAHELSHNILHHPFRPEIDKASSPLFAKTGISTAELRRTEFEADRLAVWLIARAGYDVDAAVPFWTRLGQKLANDGSSDGTYPDWNKRTDRVAAAVVEVKNQKAAGVPLIPTDLIGNSAAQQSSSHAQFPR